MVTLYVKKRHRSPIFKHFKNIHSAYRYYLLHCSTIREWIYYFKCAKLPLNKVKDEKTMKAIFDNVFRHTCIIEYL